MGDSRVPVDLHITMYCGTRIVFLLTVCSHWQTTYAIRKWYSWSKTELLVMGLYTTFHQPSKFMSFNCAWFERVGKYSRWEGREWMTVLQTGMQTCSVTNYWGKFRSFFRPSRLCRCTSKSLRVQLCPTRLSNYCICILTFLRFKSRVLHSCSILTSFKMVVGVYFACPFWFGVSCGRRYARCTRSVSIGMLVELLHSLWLLDQLHSVIMKVRSITGVHLVC